VTQKELSEIAGRVSVCTRCQLPFREKAVPGKGLPIRKSC
jgi:hypothetical protein